MTLDEYMQANRNAVFRLWIDVQQQQKTTQESSTDLGKEKAQKNIFFFVCLFSVCSWSSVEKAIIGLELINQAMSQIALPSALTQLTSVKQPGKGGLSIQGGRTHI